LRTIQTEPGCGAPFPHDSRRCRMTAAAMRRASLAWLRPACTVKVTTFHSTRSCGLAEKCVKEPATLTDERAGDNLGRGQVFLVLGRWNLTTWLGRGAALPSLQRRSQSSLSDSTPPTGTLASFIAIAFFQPPRWPWFFFFVLVGFVQ
jgi:hypothetical protein